MKYEDKEVVVAGWYFATKEVPEWGKLHKYADLGGPMAWAHICALVGDLSDEAKEFVSETYALILESLSIDPEMEFTTWSELNEYALEHDESN